MSQCTCGVGCPNVDATLLGKDYATDSTCSSPYEEAGVGFALGFANALTGGAINAFYDPLGAMKSQLTTAQQDYNNLYQQWTQCIGRCQGCITTEEITLLSDELSAAQSYQALTNEAVEEQVLALSTIVGFILIFVFMIFIYILVS